MRLSAAAQRGLCVVPALQHLAHKGSSGRMAVVGGSEDYCGAPYFAAMSALRCGCDVGYVFCPPCATAPIKSYSPDLIVRGLLTTERLPELLASLKQCHCVVIGPGMGTGPAAQALCKAIVAQLSEDAAFAHLPVVLDACAIKAVCGASTTPQLRRRNGGPPFVLTPNANEWRVMWAAASMGVECAIDGGGIANNVAWLANAWHAAVVLKGAIDIVAEPNGMDAAQPCSLDPGSPRRVAGQGDVFCGAVGALLAFRNIIISGKTHPAGADGAATASCSISDAIAAASTLVKQCALDAFQDPTFVTSDLLPRLGLARQRLMEIHRIETTAGGMGGTTTTTTMGTP